MFGRRRLENLARHRADLAARAEARDREFGEALRKAVRDARRRAMETGEDQTVEGVRIYGVHLHIKASEVCPRPPETPA